MIIYFSTVRRRRPVKDAGEVVKLDWASKKILKAVPVYPFDPDIEDDPNPRGNSRGGKGIVVSGAELLVGTYHTILVFDHQLNLQRKLTNNLFVNIHEICLDGTNIWVSSTAIDAAVLADRSGNTLKTWWPREEKLLQERYGLRPMDIDKNMDNRLTHIHAELSSKAHHTHLNSVTRSGKRTYVLLNRLGAFVQIEPEVRVVLEDPLIRGAHSPMTSREGSRLLVCSSLQKSILVYDLESGRLIRQINLLDFAEIAELHDAHPDQPFNQSIFVRGLDILDADRILVGISPAAILEVDVSKSRLLDIFRYGDDVGDAVHGLAHLEAVEMKSSL